MNVCDVMVGAWIGLLTSLIVWSLWGVHYLERQWQKTFGEKKRPSVKELLSDSEPEDNP